MLENIKKKLSHRAIRTALPSDGRTVTMRPMTGREEKILLIAKESGDRQDVLTTVLQVVDSCVIDETDVYSLPIFDVEWLFLQVRIESVAPTVNIAYVDGQDRKRYDFEVDLTQVEVVKPESTSVVDVGDGVSIEMRWPSVVAFTEASKRGLSVDVAHALAVASVSRIYDGDVVIEADQCDPDELDDLVTSLPAASYKSMMDWVEAVPSLKLSINYRNSLGNEREVVLANLTDFFRFR